jgi:hypothetical protein
MLNEDRRSGWPHPISNFVGTRSFSLKFFCEKAQRIPKKNVVA